MLGGHLCYLYTNPPYKTGFSLFMSCARHMTRLRAVSTSYHSGWRHATIVSWLANPSKSIDLCTLLFSTVSVISILNFILDLSQRGEVYLDGRLTFLPVTDTHWCIESHLFADLVGNICEFLASATRLRLCYYRTFCPTANLRRAIVRVVHVTSRFTIRCAHPSQLTSLESFALASLSVRCLLNLPTCTTVLVGLHQKGWEGERISPPILNYILATRQALLALLDPTAQLCCILPPSRKCNLLLYIFS